MLMRAQGLFDVELTSNWQEMRPIERPCRICGKIDKDRVKGNKDWQLCEICFNELGCRVFVLANGYIVYLAPLKTRKNNYLAYFHQNTLDTCDFCNGYDGCLIGCKCPPCILHDQFSLREQTISPPPIFLGWPCDICDSKRKVESLQIPIVSWGLCGCFKTGKYRQSNLCKRCKSDGWFLFNETILSHTVLSHTEGLTYLNKKKENFKVV